MTTSMSMGMGLMHEGGLKPIRQEKTIEIMVEEIREKIIELPKIEYLEKIVEYIKPVIQYKIKEVRRPVYIERIVRIPKIVEEERVVEVPQVKYVEKIVEVPTYVYKERIVEVPIPMIREIIIPVLKVHRVEREAEIPMIPICGGNSEIEAETAQIKKEGEIEAETDKIKNVVGIETHLKNWVQSWREWSFISLKSWATKSNVNTFLNHTVDIDNFKEFKEEDSKEKTNKSTILGISNIPSTKAMIGRIDLNNLTGNCYMTGYAHVTI